MLLTIYNLPYTVTFNDIKALIYSKCGIGEVILDNLVPHENHTKKVTIGLSGAEDAAIFTRKIDGITFKGHQLHVVSKTKIPKISANATQVQPELGTRSMQPFMPQNSPWSQGPITPNQDVPSMVPPPLNFVPPNMLYPNQSAYYMMNQSTYPTPPSVPNMGYQTVPYGINQGFSQSSWSNNNWNQQEQSDESQNTQPKNERDVKWDKGNSKWENSSRSRDDDSSKWDNSYSKRGDNNSKWESNNSKRGNSNWDNDRAPERGNSRESRWNNSGGSNWDSHNDPRSNNSRDSKWQSSRDSKWQSSRDSNRENTYRSNQTSSSSRLRDRDSPNRRHTQNYAPPQTSQNIYGDHVTHSSGDRFDQRDNEHNTHWCKQVPRQRSPVDRHRVQSPPQKRQHNMKSGGGPNVSTVPKINPKSGLTEPRAKQLDSMWRGKFIVAKTQSILEDSRFQYETTNMVKLRQVLKSIIKKRVNTFKDNLAMPVTQIEKKYNKTFGFQGDWVALRDSLQKVGGRLLSTVDAGAAGNEPSKKSKKKKTPHSDAGLPQQNSGFGNFKVDQRNEPPAPAPQPPGSIPIGQFIVNLLQEAQQMQLQGQRSGGPPQQRGPQFGGPPQQRGPQFGGPPQQRGPQFGGPPQQRGPQFPALPQPLPSKANKKKGAAGKQQGGQKKQTSVPLANIPGRIPQYPQGDKKLFKKVKKEGKTIVSSDLSAPTFKSLTPAVKKAIDKEVDSMCKVIDRICDNPGNEEHAAKFCSNLKEEVTDEMKRILKITVARRIIPTLPMMVRVFATPPIKRVPLENFLRNFSVSALKKSKQSPYFIAHCDTVETHDHLCLMKSVPVGGSMLTFKPLHLVNMKKVPTNKKHQQLTKEVMPQPENEPKIVNIPKNADNNDDDNDDYEIDEYHGDNNEEEDTAHVVKSENLSQDMKNICDQINNSEVNENKEGQTFDTGENKAHEQTNEEVFKSEQPTETVGNEDFSNEDNIDNIMGNISEEVTDKNIVQDQAGDETHDANEPIPTETAVNNQRDENIDMADVNEEDLEDW